MDSTTQLADVFARLYQCAGMDERTLVAVAAGVRETLPLAQRAGFTDTATMSGLPLELESAS